MEKKFEVENWKTEVQKGEEKNREDRDIRR